jgi:hypothetical protein
MNKNLLKFSYFIPLLGILVLAFLLSSRMIISGDFFYLFDQARDYLLVKEIIDTKSITLIGTHSGMGGFFHGPLWLYMLIPIYLLGHGNPLAFAHFYILLNLITVLIAFLVGLKLYGKIGGLVISFLIAISPALWASTPNFIGVNMVPMVFLGLFYFLVKYIRGDQRSFIFAAFFAGLSLQFETALPLVFISTLLVIFFVNKKAIKDLKLIILSIIAFTISIATFILFDLRHNFLMSTTVLKSFSQDKTAKDYLDITQRIPSHIESLVNTYRSILFKDDLFFLFIITAILLFASFLFLKTKNKYKKEFFILLLYPSLVFILFIFYPYPIYREYVFGLLIPITFAFYLAIKQSWNIIAGKILTVIFFGITALYLISFLQTQYLGNYEQNNSSGSYKNQKSAIEWIYKDAKDGRFGYFVYSPSVYTHTVDYLMSYLGKNNKNVVLENQKNKFSYLVFYPHLDNDPGAYEFWKKNTIRTQGKVIESKMFKGNITVEKILVTEGEEPVDPNYYQSLLFR